MHLPWVIASISDLDSLLTDQAILPQRSNSSRRLLTIRHSWISGQVTLSANKRRIMTKKEALSSVSFFISRAHEKTRTSKSVRSLHPECSVFTNFTTWASGGTFGAQDKSRTCTTQSSLPPQSSVSTNFTTWAWGCFSKSVAKIQHFSIR